MEKGGVEKGSWGGGRAPLHYLRTFRRKSKSILRTLLNSPSLCDVQAPALKRHAGPRPFTLPLSRSLLTTARGTPEGGNTIVKCKQNTKNILIFIIFI